MATMNHELSIAFIGGGNMASALGSGLIGKRCGAHDVHVIDINPEALKHWAEQGCSTATAADETLSTRRIWVLAVKPQFMKETVAGLRPFLRPDTLVVGIAAGISAESLGLWLGSADQPWTRLVRAMPNTPALIAAGATGLMAVGAVSEAALARVPALSRAVGEVVWGEDDHSVDVATSLSGSGPAYACLLLDAMIAAAVEQGRAADTVLRLGFATGYGATYLAA